MQGRKNSFDEVEVDVTGDLMMTILDFIEWSARRL